MAAADAASLVAPRSQTSLQQRLVKPGGSIDQVRPLLAVFHGREPSDAAAVCRQPGEGCAFAVGSPPDEKPAALCAISNPPDQNRLKHCERKPFHLSNEVELEIPVNFSSTIVHLVHAQGLDLTMEALDSLAPPSRLSEVTFDRVEGMLLGLAIGDALGNTAKG